MKFCITPQNEGQDLNYTETRDFPSKKHARIYGREMARKLAKALPKGLIRVKFERVKL